MIDGMTFNGEGAGRGFYFNPSASQEMTVQLGGQTAEFDERRVNIEQLSGTSAGGGFDNARPAEDERHTSRTFPKRILACDAFFSEMLLPEVNRWPLASHVVKGCKH